MNSTDLTAGRLRLLFQIWALPKSPPISQAIAVSFAWLKEAKLIQWGLVGAAPMWHVTPLGNQVVEVAVSSSQATLEWVWKDKLTP